MVRSGVRGVAVPAVVLALGLVLGACGGDESGVVADESDAPTASPSSSPAPATQTPSESDPPSDAPACTEVWTEGAEIPRSYQGCSDEGAFVERDVVACSSGQRFVRFDDRFYGVLGGTVREATGGLEQDRDYRDAVESCLA